MKIPTSVISNTVVALDAEQPDKEVLARAAAILADGGLVVAPTETTYGLLARADDEMALKKMFAAKRRTKIMPSAVFCDSIDRCWEYGMHNEAAAALAKEFLPGPLTLILKARQDWNRFITPEKLIGLRCSASPVVRELLRKVSFPLTATSANISGAGESDSIEQIQAAFGSAINLYLDGGVLTGEASTVVYCTESPVRILRQGSISEQEILRVLQAASNE